MLYLQSFHLLRVILLSVRSVVVVKENERWKVVSLSCETDLVVRQYLKDTTKRIPLFGKRWKLNRDRQERENQSSCTIHKNLALLCIHLAPKSIIFYVISQYLFRCFRLEHLRSKGQTDFKWQFRLLGKLKCPYSQVVINWYKATGFTGLINIKDHGAITLAI